MLQEQKSTQHRARWVLALASVASLMVSLDTLVVATALDTIRRDLTASVAQLEWTVNSYNLALAVVLMPAAALGDRFGRRLLFAGGLMLFIASSAACALAPGINTLIAARTVQGVGAAFVLALSLALVSAAYPPKGRGAAIGILEGVTGVAVAAGPVVGGAVTGGLAWEWIFWMNVPIGLVAIPFVWSKMSESRGTDTTVDIRGVGLVTIGALGIVWALVRGNSVGWGSAEAVASFVIGVAGVVAFVVWERRAAEPMLPVSYFRVPAFASGNAATFFMFAALFGSVFFLTQFLQAGLGYGPLEAGVRLLPWTLTLFFVAPVAGAVADRFGGRVLLVAGLGLQAVGMGWIAAIADPGMPYADMVPPLMIAGCGVSMAMPPAQNAVMNAVAAVGKAAGANSMIREFGGVFGIALLVAVFAGAGGYATASDFVSGFTPVMWGVAALSIAGAAAGLWLPAGGSSTHTTPAPTTPVSRPEQGTRS